MDGEKEHGPGGETHANYGVCLVGCGIDLRRDLGGYRADGTSVRYGFRSPSAARCTSTIVEGWRGGGLGLLLGALVSPAQDLCEGQESAFGCRTHFLHEARELVEGLKGGRRLGRAIGVHQPNNNKTQIEKNKETMLGVLLHGLLDLDGGLDDV